MIQPTYGTFWPRLGATFVDFALLTLLTWPIDVSAAPSAAGWLSKSLVNFGPLLYTIVLHARFGQTAGKWLLGLRVVTTDFQRIGWRHAWWRSALDLLLTVVALSLPDDDATTIRFGVVVLIWLLAEIGVMLFNERRRSVHDYIAGTVVVAGQARRLNPQAPADHAVA